MFVKIRCSNPRHDGRTRAGRQFVNGTEYVMEVAEAPLAKAEQDAHGNGPLDPATKAPSMTKIDRAGLERIKADPVMSVLEGGDTGAALSQAAFDEARSQLKHANEQLADARIEIAQLQSELSAAKADLEAAAAALPPPPDLADADHGKKDSKDKAGKGK